MPNLSRSSNTFANAARLLRLGSARGFSPASLFAAGEVGAWYDPSDFSTMFQESTGVTPVTAVEQPVGLLLDKSKSLSLGSNIVNSSVTAGGWSSSFGGTTASGSQVTFAVQYGTWAYSATTVDGGFYEFRFTARNISGNTALTFYHDSFGTSNFTTGLTISSTAQEYVVRPPGKSGGGAVLFGFQDRNAAGQGAVEITNVSVKLINGIHASQATPASRPMLSARVNLLTRTEDFTNAAWATGSALNGTRTNGSVSVSLVNGYCYIRQLVTLTTGRAYTASFDVVCDQTIANVPIRIAADSGTAASTLLSMTANQVYRVSLSGMTGGTVHIELGIDVRAGVVPGGSTSTGYTVTFNRADLRVTNTGTNLPAYQAVVTSTNYDTSGFPLYLKFDGVDDSLATGTITPGVDKAQVFAGVRKLSDAAVSYLVEYSAIVSANAGAFNLLAPGTAATAEYTFRSRGDAVSVPATASPYAAPITNVISGIASISEDVSQIRVNGAVIQSNSIDQGLGNYLAYPLYIGGRAGTSFPFNGNLYGLIVRFSSANLAAATISSTETWLNGKTRAF